MATSYNPIAKNIDFRNEYTTISNINEIIKNWFVNYDLPTNIQDIEDNQNIINYIQNFIKNTNKLKQIKNQHIYWDIEAQKFLVE
jgi:hypothetical protein